ncbi:branched-chain amino acid ABC transporter permease [Pusillimonas sp. CC-YST705]|uniref:Branched-chain amino acid ABC transporter permease n=1 Tax=Mesopusillimonas faecipullorum TaxID=2755040 RepID=A0ABS8CBA4_9BURK|nr:branched-chain amino acid ABC transporter permease [Mesopusillimonas faecipullorum]MCB5363268.1 branched-chain amino acid ABC transporter permease [Mesopusillimonas faecipullorum]
MPDITVLLQTAFSGLTLGAVYALIAVSLVMVYKVSKIVCFAQGEFFVIGGLTLATFTNQLGWPLWQALPATLAIAALLGMVIERGVIRPVRHEGVGTVIVMTIALSISLQGIALPIWGREAHVVPPFTGLPPLEVLGAFLSAQVIIVILIALAVFAALWYFFEYSLLGIAMRAAAQAPIGARLVGISVSRLTRFGWASGVALGALAGAVIAPLLFVSYSAGTLPMVKAFIAMAVGGLSSTAGALVGGFAIGLMEAYIVGFVSSEFADAIVFLFLIGFLLWRPNGLFGTDDKGGM